MSGYRFIVQYDIKHIKKSSALYGLLTTQTVNFPTLQTAMSFVRDMKGKRTDKFEVIGMPIIERIA
jgi:hypothetical protein